MSKKTTYIATAPDGTTKTRTTERNYPFAVAVLFAAVPEHTRTGVHYVTADQLPEGVEAVDLGWDRGDGKGNVFKYEGERTIPATPAYWLISSFHGTRAAAEKASPGYRGAVRKIVIETTTKGQSK